MSSLDGIIRNNSDSKHYAYYRQNSRGMGLILLLVIGGGLLAMRPNLPTNETKTEDNQSEAINLVSNQSIPQKSISNQSQNSSNLSTKITLQIFNASGKAGQAADLKLALETGEDYNVISIGTIEILDKSSIHYQKNYFAAAQNLNQLLGKELELIISDQEDDVNLILIIGKDFDDDFSQSQNQTKRNSD